MRPRLAISLNASTDEERDAIMPINRKYPLEALLAACREYPLGPREHLTFEYVLLGGFNDSAEDARRVARLLSGMRAKVNLIPWNPGELPYRAPAPERVEEFRAGADAKGVPAFVRYSRGQDVSAACGQLALIERGSLVPAIGSSPSGRFSRAFRYKFHLARFPEDSDHAHHAAGGRAFSPIAEKKVAAAGGAERAHGNVPRAARRRRGAAGGWPNANRAGRARAAAHGPAASS